MEKDEKPIATQAERDNLLKVLEGIHWLKYSKREGRNCCFLRYDDGDRACQENAETHYVCAMCELLAEYANVSTEGEKKISEAIKELKAIKFCKHCNVQVD